MSSHKSLAGLRVLITRPERQLEPITDTLRQLDGMVFHFSLIEIEKIKSATRIAVIKQKVERLQNYDKLIFVSSNAVKYVVAEPESASWSRFDGVNAHDLSCSDA